MTWICTGRGVIGDPARELALRMVRTVSCMTPTRALERWARKSGPAFTRRTLSPYVVSLRGSEADAVVRRCRARVGFAMPRTVIEAGSPSPNLFLAEDRAAETLARERGATAVVDCGVSPGLSNFFVGRSARDFNEVEDVRIYVGGLPFARRWPFEYAAVFSPADVVEEYTRPARIFEEGRLVTRPPLSEVERIEAERQSAEREAF